MTYPSLLIFVLATLALALAAPSADEVTYLPGQNWTEPLSFKHYSGYLKSNGEKRLHYWFIEAQDSPADKPVVLWMNGGPGCSSLDGELYEHGAFFVSEDGNTIYLNPYSWNTVANMLYMEAPVGVGFSYSPNSDDYYNTDEGTASDNYEALLNFFELFPEYKSNEFFITGESYGGIYVPTLSKNVLDGNNAGKPFINMTGFAIGNGLLDTDMNSNSAIYFSYYHGLFGDDLWADLNNACDNGVFYPSSGPLCTKYGFEAQNAMYSAGLNYYDIDRECYHSTKEAEVTLSNLFPQVDFDLGSSDSQSKRENVPCIDSDGATVWLNKLEVQEALHVNTNLTYDWTICSDVLRYKKTIPSTLYLFEELLQSYRSLIYNGDTDLACNFLGDQWGVASLGQSVTQTRRPWYVDSQVAGYVDVYDKISFTTVKGVGHMVPQWAPERALYMFTQFLKDQPLV